MLQRPESKPCVFVSGCLGFGFWALVFYVLVCGGGLVSGQEKKRLSL